MERRDEHESGPRASTAAPPRGARAKLKRIGAIVALELLVLATAELFLRHGMPELDLYFTWWPGLEKEFHPAADLLPGISGPSRFAANRYGLRGDDPPAGESYRILCVGGSSTECLMLDQRETWAELLEAELAAARPRVATWVANAGKSGLNARDHRVQLRALLGQETRIDLVIVLAGVNDLNLRLAQDGAYDPTWLARTGAERVVLEHAFQLLPRALERRQSWWKRTGTWRLLGTLRSELWPPLEVLDDYGRVHATWRAHRAGAARWIDELPDLAPALAEFRANLSALAATCRERRARLVLVAQPAMWDAELAAEDSGLLWFGGIGDYMEQAGSAYYTAGALARGMALFQAALLETAAAEGVEAVDLAAGFPRDRSVFYDDVHFNEEGARRVARVLAGALLERPPYAE